MFKSLYYLWSYFYEHAYMKNTTHQGFVEGVVDISAEWVNAEQV